MRSSERVLAGWIPTTKGATQSGCHVIFPAYLPID